ncbi:MAG: sodium:proton antiporter [Synoicihabitans sp.]
MDAYTLVAVILFVTTGAALFNKRLLRLPESVGLMGTALFVSILFLGFGLIFPAIVEPVCQRILSIDFSFIVLELLLGFLIFAGAFSSDTSGMAMQRWPIVLFATVGILISTFVVGAAMWGILGGIGLGIPFLHCLLFGALISPTDPIAVLAILKTTGVPRSLQADIAGESLLNDGVAVVVFLTLFQLAGGMGSESGHAGEFGAMQIAALFGREVIGGVILGGIGGWLTTIALRLARNDAIDILVTVAAVMTVYASAWKLHVSGPLALVVVGIMVALAINSERTDPEERDHLETFWEAIDHLLNAVLFTLMGFVVLSLVDTFQIAYLLAGLLAIPVVLGARLISLGVTVPLTSLRRGNISSTLSLLTWGGLRGGISIALALSLRPEMSRELIVFVTYIVVVFSILVQAMSIGKLVKRLGITNETN